jgi:hypothetical protein
VQIATAGPRVSQSSDHADKSQGGENGEEDVVGEDEVVERPGLADAPRPHLSVPVQLVQDDGCGCVESSNCDWNLPIEHTIVDFGGYGEWTGKGAVVSRRRQRCWERVWRPCEERCRWHTKLKGRTGHGDCGQRIN